MKRVNRIVAAAFAAVVMTMTAAAPANALVDSNGNVVAIILTPDGEIYY